MTLAQAILAASLLAPDAGPDALHGGFDPSRCPIDVQLRALSSVTSAGHSWKTLHFHFHEYGQCDAGAIADGYSVDVVTLLARDWKLVGELASFVRADPPFLPFVLTHIDAAAATENLQEVLRNAWTACPRRHGELCRRIAERAQSALERQEVVQRR